MDLHTSSSDKDFIESLYYSINADVLIIHRANDALGYDGVTFDKCNTFFCKEPIILTGGGDNFNAGFCFALFHDFDLYWLQMLYQVIMLKPESAHPGIS